MASIAIFVFYRYFTQAELIIRINEGNPMKDENVSYSSRSADKFVVRLPEGMREKIASIAKCYHRSMNSEIINRLEKSLTLDDSLPANNDLSEKMEAFAEIRAASRDEEQLLLSLFRTLPREKQRAVIAFLETMNG